jgi:hypothetical protein
LTPEGEARQDLQTSCLAFIYLLTFPAFASRTDKILSKNDNAYFLDILPFLTQAFEIL